jgi:ABC-2 type transport system ATP-binding protein
MSAADRVIRVDDLVKIYGSKRAVDGVSFTVCRGEIFALLGPNGAGKTTTIEILEGYRRPEHGVVSVLGCDPIRQAAQMRPRIGAMPQEGGLYPNIKPIEALKLFARFYPHSADPLKLLHDVALEESRTTPYRRLSGGQKQRLSLALALIGQPELLFLDEPTAGLDPQGRRSTWELIGRLRKQGVTVVLTTHYLEEVETLADRVAIIDVGRLVALDRPASLIARDGSVVRVRAAQEIELSALGTLPSAVSVRYAGPTTYAIETEDAASLLVELTSWSRNAGITLTELRVGEGSLEDAFLRLTGKDLEP